MENEAQFVWGKCAMCIKTTITDMINTVNEMFKC